LFAAAAKEAEKTKKAPKNFWGCHIEHTWLYLYGVLEGGA
jgi:hypothetical protein